MGKPATTKQCSKCGIEKSLNSFVRQKDGKHGRHSSCKCCVKKYRLENKAKIAEGQRRYRTNNKHLISERQKKYYQDNKESLAEKQKKYYQDNKEVIAEQGKQYRKNNKKAISERRKKQYQANRGDILKQRKIYYAKNKDNIIKQKRQYIIKRKSEDPVYRLVCSMRSRLGSILRSENPKEETTMELIGCTAKHLKHHLSEKFSEGMSWDNYGRGGWVCDHIQPVSDFDQTNKEHRKLCWHYTNLQPLWDKDNTIKSNKTPDNHQCELPINIQTK